MGIQERRTRQKLSLRQEILDAARELFVRDGYENVTMRRIAERIEYSPTTIYLHFKDKDELLHEICEEMFRELADQLEAVSAAETDPVEGLKKGLRTYIEYGIRHPQHYRVTFMMPADYPIPAEEYPRSSQGGRAFTTLVTAVGKCIAAGRFAETEIMLASQILWAGVHGLTSLLIAEPDFPWADRKELIPRMVEFLVKGFERQ
jgi:AcrR family transcriptional regulator